MAWFELPRTPACDPVEELLPEIARAIRDGDDAAARWSTAARHVGECVRCTAIVEALATRPEVDDVPEIPVEPNELFQRALIEGLADPDPIVRSRAATHLSELEPLRVHAIAALAAAAQDEDERVRSAALMALDRLDEQVSIPRRIIEAWASSPDEAAPFISGVLARLGGEHAPGHRGVTELVAGTRKKTAHYTGISGARVRLARERERLWLSLDNLPEEFDDTRPVVAVPDAVEAKSVGLEWTGDQPGLVRSEEAVAGGSLRIPLAKITRRGIDQKLQSFRRIYLLTPGAERTPEGHGA